MTEEGIEVIELNGAGVPLDNDSPEYDNIADDDDMGFPDEMPEEPLPPPENEIRKSQLRMLIRRLKSGRNGKYLGAIDDDLSAKSQAELEKLYEDCFEHIKMGRAKPVQSIAPMVLGGIERVLAIIDPLGAHGFAEAALKDDDLMCDIEEFEVRVLEQYPTFGAMPLKFRLPADLIMVYTNNRAANIERAKLGQAPPSMANTPASSALNKTVAKFI